MRRFATTASAARANRSKAANTRVRPAREADARAIADVHVASWQAAYRGVMSDEYLAALSTDRRTAMWREAIVGGSPQLLVAERDAAQGARVEGWIAFGRSRDAGAPAGTGEIWAFYAHPDAWSTGVGRALWAGAHAGLRAHGFDTVVLWVLTANPRARRFYQQLGLVPEPAQLKSFSMGGRTLEQIRYTGALGTMAPTAACP
jgi:GNAT superfamily N-acetyltransferase